MGTIFVAGSYGVGKSTLCKALSSEMNIPDYSAGDLISNINGEQYGANKYVENKVKNQDILAIEVEKKLQQNPRIILAGHFCIFNKLNNVEKLPDDIFERIDLEQILLLEADPRRILFNLSSRDKRNYDYNQMELLSKEERRAAEAVSNKCGCKLNIHSMSFDGTDLKICMDLLSAEDLNL